MADFIQSELVGSPASPEGEFDGPCGYLMADNRAGDVYVKGSPLGTRDGWKKLVSEGGGVVVGTGDPGEDTIGTSYFDETEGAEALWFKKSDDSWFKLVAVSALVLLLTLLQVFAGPSIGGIEVLPAAANVMTGLTNSAGTVTVNLATNGTYAVVADRTLSFTGTGMEAGTKALIEVTTDGSDRSVTWNGSWVWLGAPAPGTLTASHTFWISLYCRTNTAAGVRALYTESIP